MTVRATPPKTRYARTGDVHIAYQVVGEGPVDLVFVPGWFSHIEAGWDWPPQARFLERLSSFTRLILMDRRGVGLSDPIAGTPTLEDRVDDIRSVMDAAGSERAALLGISEAGAMNLLFAATYPQRTEALILYGTFACGGRKPDYKPALTREQWANLLDRVERDWGEGVAIQALAPGLARDEEFLRAMARFERLAASPGAAVASLAICAEIDVRDVLPSIRVPTLVLHRGEDRMILPEAGRHLAEHIPGARYVELPGDDHIYWAGDIEPLLDEVAEFLTGSRSAHEPDRALATILFTDIVASTERATELGDRRWRELLERHDMIVRRQLERFRGREVKSVGDGFLATFDGPARAIRCARAIVDAVPALGLEVRAGLHSGECEMMDGDIGGIAVHIGARVGALAGPGEVLVSGTVKELVVGSGIEFEDREAAQLRGVPGEWRLFAALG